MWALRAIRFKNCVLPCNDTKTWSQGSLDESSSDRFEDFTFLDHVDATDDSESGQFEPHEPEDNGSGNK